MPPFFLFERQGKPQPHTTSVETLHQLECKACPLNNAPLRHPKMEPTGSAKPMVYILGEAPGEYEDRRGEQFIGKAGQILRSRIPQHWLEHIRWNNVIRSRPPDNRKPEFTEIECCRPSIIRDIEKCKPAAIFGFGAVPLEWATGDSRVSYWAGRRTPIRIGDHTCWFYSHFHPSYVGHTRRFDPKGDGVGSELERAFVLNLERAFAEVKAGLPEPKVYSTTDLSFDVTWSTDVDQIVQYLKDAAWTNCGTRGFDIETNMLRPYAKDAKILTVAMSDDTLGTFAFPLDHPGTKWTKAQREQVEEAFINYLIDDVNLKAVHNLAFEMEWIGVKYSPRLLRKTRWACTMVQAYVLDERQGDKKSANGPKSLDFLCRQYLGINLKSLTKLDRKKLVDAPLNDVLHYNGIDAKGHRLIHEPQAERIKTEGLEHVNQERQRHIPTCVLSQIKGIPLDSDKVQAFVEKLEPQIKQAAEVINATGLPAKFTIRTRQAYNPGSNDHNAIILRDILGRKEGFVEDAPQATGQVGKETRSDGYSPGKLHRSKAKFSTDQNVLNTIAHPFAGALLAWRKPSKLLSTYIDPFRPGSKLIYPGNLLHPIISTTTVETGRTSSEEPNEQNFPHRENPWAREIVGRKGLRCIAFDYGQIQVRNVAMESLDKTLIKALWENYDIHGEWARKIAFADPARIGGKKALADKDVMKWWRNECKGAWTFKLLFGGQLYTTARSLQIDERKLKPLYEEFWTTYHGVKAWHEKAKKQYEQGGYIKSLSGFRRRAPIDPNQLINPPIQAD